NCSQNTDDRNHDHQLDQCKTFLHLCLHFSTPFVFEVAVGLIGFLQEMCQLLGTTGLSACSVDDSSHCRSLAVITTSCKRWERLHGRSMERQDVTFFVRHYWNRETQRSSDVIAPRSGPLPLLRRRGSSLCITALLYYSRR